MVVSRVVEAVAFVQQPAKPARVVFAVALELFRNELIHNQHHHQARAVLRLGNAASGRRQQQE